MAIVGFNLTKISIERKETITGELKVNSKVDVTNVQKEKMTLVPGKDTLKFSFEFSIDYEPDFAKIDFKGFLLITEDPKTAKDIVKNWKTKKVDKNLKEQIFNLILRKCNIKAFGLEEDLNLPTHFPFPKVKAE